MKESFLGVKQSRRLLGWSVFALVIIPAVFTGFFPGKIVIVAALCGYLVASLYILSKLPTTGFSGKTICTIFLFYSCIIYVRGFFNIDSDHDVYALFWSSLFLCFLIPRFIFLSQPQCFALILKGILYLGVPLCLVTLFNPPSDEQLSFAHNASFLYLFLLFIPFLKKKWVVLIVLAGLFVVTYNIDRRSILVNMAFSFIISFIWLFSKNTFLLKLFFGGIVSITCILLILGLSGVFNIFQAMGDSYDYSLDEEARNLFVDSRTGIYNDVFGGLSSKNSLVFGLGVNGKTETSLIDAVSFDFSEIYRYGRPSTESGMLNYIQYGGILGGLLYSAFILCAGYRATFYAENSLLRLVGVFVAFKFAFSFVEDKVSLNTNTLITFLCIGLCYNREFCSMSDDEITQYLNCVFK